MIYEELSKIIMCGNKKVGAASNISYDHYIGILSMKILTLDRDKLEVPGPKDSIFNMSLAQFNLRFTIKDYSLNHTHPSYMILENVTSLATQIIPTFNEKLLIEKINIKKKKDALGSYAGELFELNESNEDNEIINELNNITGEI